MLELSPARLFATLKALILAWFRGVGNIKLNPVPSRMKIKQKHASYYSQWVHGNKSLWIDDKSVCKWRDLLTVTWKLRRKSPWARQTMWHDIGFETTSAKINQLQRGLEHSGAPPRDVAVTCSGALFCPAKGDGEHNWLVPTDPLKNTSVVGDCHHKMAGVEMFESTY